MKITETTRQWTIVTNQHSRHYSYGTRHLISNTITQQACQYRQSVDLRSFFRSTRGGRNRDVNLEVDRPDVRTLFGKCFPFSGMRVFGFWVRFGLGL